MHVLKHFVIISNIKWVSWRSGGERRNLVSKSSEQTI